MAPGRKKGASKAKQKGHLQLGDLVLAKVKGFPAWPAKISMPEEWDRAPDPKKFFVQFFGTQEIAFVAPAEIQEFNNEVKIKVRSRCQGKTVKYFAQAVQEICEEFDQQQQSSGTGVNDSESTLKDEVAPSRELEEDLGFQIKDDNDTEVSESTDGGFRHNLEENDKHENMNSINSCSPVTPSLQICTPKKVITQSDGSNLEKKIPFLHFNNPNIVKDFKTDIDAEYGNIASDGGIISSTVNDLSDDCILVQDPQEGSGQSLFANGHKVGKIGFSSEKKKRNVVKGVYNGDDGQSEENRISKVEIGFQSSLGQTVIESCENKSNTRRTKIGGRNKPKKLSGFSKILKTENDSHGDVVSSSEPPGNGNIIKPKKRGLVNHKSVSPADMVDGTDLKPPVKKKKSDLSIHPTSKPMDKYPELKNSTPNEKSDERLALHEGDVACSDATCDEAALPLTKRRKRAFEAMVDSKSSLSERTFNNNKSVTVRKFKPRVKRRALCIDDDDEEEPRTPVHHGFNEASSMVNPTQQILKNTPEFNEQIPNSSHNSDRKSADAHVKNNTPQKSISKKYNPDDDCMKEYISPMKHLKESSSPKQEVAEKKPKKSAPVPHSEMVERSFSKETTSGNASKSPKQSNIVKPAGKSSNSVVKKNQSDLSDKGSGFLSKSSRNQTSASKKRPASVGEVSKPFTSRNTFTNHTTVLTETTVEANKSRTNDDTSTSVLDTKTSESVMSMKHLIAAAQAKRRQAQIHVMPQNSNSSAFILPVRNSPGPGSVIQPFSSSNDTTQHHAYDYFSHTMEMVSPSIDFQQLPQHQIDVEGSDERRRSSGHYAGDGSLSGGTEAAVSRDAFEGMIETLSRTKESIGRATRLAIDCAKYGIANEVVELLVRKLENEISFHRKVDLFFLVDSITQCSHSQKGIAGASYIPIVQSALPRLLAAVAPPGIGAHENRRQCLKVLRLWLERKILPDSLLRRYIEEFGGSNDDMNTGAFLRRPSRAERAVDDPIREMEGMFVDEYGSNASFQLPGFLYSRVFEDEEDDDEEDEDELEHKESGREMSPPGPIFDYKNSDVSHVSAKSECERTTYKSPVGVTHGQQNADVTIDTLTDECNNLLVGTVGDLQVEDKRSQLKNSKPLTGDSVVMDSEYQGCDNWSVDSASNKTSCQSPQLSGGSPPLPLDPPSPLPPLPSSPQSPDSLHSPKPSPPPLPPRSPSPPPPPPTHPPPLSVPMSFLHQQHALSSHSRQVLPSASTAVGHQHTLPNALRDGANGSQPLPMAGPITHVISGHEISSNSQQCQINQLYQGNTPFPQNSFKHVPSSRTPASHFLYPTSTPLPQHPHPSTYVMVTQPDGNYQYGTDEQWRTLSNDATADGHRGVWMNGGRTFGSLVQVPEGYFQPPERIPNESKVFQPGTFPSGAGVSMMIPCRSDIPSTNCWRPV